MTRVASVGIVGTVLACLLMAGPLSRADEPKAPSQAVEDFGNKVLVVIATAGNQTERLALEKVRIKRLGDRAFLVGTEVEKEDESRRNRPAVWVSLHTVTAIYEYDSLAEFRKAAQPGQ